MKRNGTGKSWKEMAGMQQLKKGQKKNNNE